MFKSAKKRKWVARVCLLFLIFLSWIAVFVLSFKPKGVFNILKAASRPIIRFFYTPEILVLGNFEIQSELNDWYREAAFMSLFWDFSTLGQASVKIEFVSSKTSGIDFPNVMLENYILGPKGEKDWSRYNWLKIDFYNSTDAVVPLFIKIKDSRFRTIQEEFNIEGKKKTCFSIRLDEISDIIDLKNIVHLSFFLCNPQEDAILLMDNIRLEEDQGQLTTARKEPFLTFIELDAPRDAKLDETIAISCSFKTACPINRDYMVFIHLAPLKSKVRKPSRRPGFLKADVWPHIPTRQWETQRVYKVGPVGIYIPYNNPEGEYGIWAGLFNPAQYGKAELRFNRPSKGSIDFTGSNPKLGYANRDIANDYMVGRIHISK